jgi:nuclear transport factor 2 (NTF2) superfamily protein
MNLQDHRRTCVLYKKNYGIMNLQDHRRTCVLYKKNYGILNLQDQRTCVLYKKITVLWIYRIIEQEHVYYTNQITVLSIYRFKEDDSSSTWEYAGENKSFRNES